jgi:hypothetical protein
MFKKKEKEEVVSCETCKCLLYKKDVLVLNVRNGFSGGEYYCHVCKPPYDEIDYMSFAMTPKYRKLMNVTKEGEPIGYIKKK